MDNYHTPVLVEEVIAGLDVKPGLRYIDATLGGGGHSWELVRRGALVLSIDTDREAIEYVREKTELGDWSVLDKKQWQIAEGNFRNIAEIANKHRFDKVDGILFDLGVSSHQLDEPKRGFSYRFVDANLDFRLSQQLPESAADLLNGKSVTQLTEIFEKYGEEEKGSLIAGKVVRMRQKSSFRSIGELIGIINTVDRGDRVKARIFQSLRIAVNDELNALRMGLFEARKLLSKGGRLVVISFHSLEDRIVKQFLGGPGWRPVGRQPQVASNQELARNLRARSAKLRIAEKI